MRDQLAALTKQNAELVQKFDSLSERLAQQEIDSYDDLVKYDKKGAEVLIKLAAQAPAAQLEGKCFGFFGVTSSGKSSIINRLLGKDVAEVGPGETTTKIQGYEHTGYCLYDIPGRNDDLSYFSMQYVSFWKGLTRRIVVVNATLKEMTKVFRLLDAIELHYDILVNKFDTVPFESRDSFKQKIRGEVQQCGLKGVKNIWFVSAENPKQFPDWLAMVHFLTDI